MKAADLEAALAAVPPAWQAVLPGWAPAALEQVRACIVAASGEGDIAPDDPYRALRLVPPDGVKVVVIGQDPYPTAGHADGLAFSSQRGRPRSLARVFEVLAADRPGFAPPATSSLDAWAYQGVLLLNPVLTIAVGHTGSHQACGWQALTHQIVEYLSGREKPPAFLLWGGKARDFFIGAGPAAGPTTVHATRHPSYDFDRRFMAEGSHFEATAHLVDWWAIGRAGSPVL